MRSTRLVSLAAVAVAGLVVAGCGDSESVEPTPTSVVEYEEIRSEGHGEGDDHEGHDLAVGANTPKDPKGRFYLHHGDRGPDVTTLQERLNELGADLGAADGVFGDRTLQAVMIFQRAESIQADGVVGTATWAALDDPSTTDIDWTAADLPTEHSTEPVAETTSATTPPPPRVLPAMATRRTSGRIRHRATTPRRASGPRASSPCRTSRPRSYDSAGNIVFQAPISSGKNGLTPTGTFHVQSKSERAYAGQRRLHGLDDPLQRWHRLPLHPQEVQRRGHPHAARAGTGEPRLHPHGRRQRRSSSRTSRSELW
ncbi:MAG: L,D-transpeptidase family protein [Microthrixaceae bacterium]|nr:L,D-transpeptidase family protein [Microthrixaceae bacterium]